LLVIIVASKVKHHKTPSYPTKGAEPPGLPTFLWDRLLTPTPFDVERPNSAQQPTRETACFWEQPRSPIPGGETQHSQFLTSYLRPHHFTQNHQTLHNNLSSDEASPSWSNMPPQFNGLDTNNLDPQMAKHCHFSP